MFVFLFELVKDNKCEVWNNYIFLKKMFEYVLCGDSWYFRGEKVFDVGLVIIG